MGLFKTYQSEAYEWGLWHIQESAEELLEQLQLNDEERRFYAGLYHGKRQLHWLSSRVLLRLMLRSPDFIDLRVDEHHKPYLFNFPYPISISHSHDYAAVMIGKKEQVGIDIEHISGKIEKIAPRFLNNEELEFIDHTQPTLHQYACWCAKEALYKWHGKKGLDFKENIRLNPFLPEDKLIKAELHIRDERHFLNVGMTEVDGYMLCWVCG